MFFILSLTRLKDKRFGADGGQRQAAMDDLHTHRLESGTMKIDEVPQDDNKTYQGYGTKAMYALDGEGRYVKTTTSGWDVEEVVLRDVLDDFTRKAAEAKTRALAGLTSPIEYYLFKRLMDLSALSQAMGLAKWRIRRHLRPEIFRKLSDTLLGRYADIFRIDIDRLKHFKEICTGDDDS
jgi:hypothetical protein